MTGMRRFVVVAALVLALLVLAACGSSSSSKSTSTASSAASVTIANYKFVPPMIALKAGGTIKFTNTDSTAHTATADDSSFDTGALQQGQSKTVTFKTAGTFTYHCSFHPFMMAKVVVT